MQNNSVTSFSQRLFSGFHTWECKARQISTVSRCSTQHLSTSSPENCSRRVHHTANDLTSAPNGKAWKKHASFPSLRSIPAHAQKPLSFRFHCPGARPLPTSVPATVLPTQVAKPVPQPLAKPWLVSLWRCVPMRAHWRGLDATCLGPNGWQGHQRGQAHTNTPGKG